MVIIFEVTECKQNNFSYFIESLSIKQKHCNIDLYLLDCSYPFRKCVGSFLVLNTIMQITLVYVFSTSCVELCRSNLYTTILKVVKDSKSSESKFTYFASQTCQSTMACYLHRGKWSESFNFINQGLHQTFIIIFPSPLHLHFQN